MPSSGATNASAEPSALRQRRREGVSDPAPQSDRADSDDEGTTTGGQVGKGRRWTPILLGLMAAALVLALLYVDGGHSWSTDFAQYVAHAKNLAEGRPYADTGYIQNPDAFLAPQAYPVGFPLMLAPFYAVFGLDLLPIKVGLCVLIVASMAVAMVLFRGRLALPYRVALVAFFGLSPYVVQLADQVISDVPFMLLTLLSLLALGRTYEAAPLSGRQGRWAALGLVAMGGAVVTRALGLALPLAVIGYGFLRLRRLPKGALALTAAMAALCVGLYVGQNVTIAAAAEAGQETTEEGEASSGKGENYEELFRQNVSSRLDELARTVATSAYGYAKQAQIYWRGEGGPTSGFVTALHLLLLTLAGVGYVLQLRGSFTLTEVFVLVYGAALLPWGFVVPRYVLPVVPLLLFYALTALQHLDARLQRRTGARGPVLLSALTLAMLATYGAGYARLDFERTSRGPLSPDAHATYEHVRQHTDPDDVVIFRRPRVLALYTGRSSAIYHQAGDAELFAYFRRLDAGYVLEGGNQPGSPMRALAERHPGRFRSVFRRGEYELYRLDEPAAARP